MNTISAEVTGLEINGGLKIIKTTDGNYTGKTVILAGGAVRRKLGVEGETRLMGRGVSYCAVCDGSFFQGRNLVVIGGGDTAITEALHLTHFATKVTIIHRRDQLRATYVLQQKVKSEPKIDYLWDSVVTGIEGAENVERIKLLNVKTGETSVKEVSGVFVAVGTSPDTEYIKGIVPLDESGYIITNEKMETAIPGILAAGDGATAAIYAQKYLTESI